MSNKRLKKQTTAAPKNTQRAGMVHPLIVENAVMRTRTAISDWRAAIKTAENVNSPKRVKLYNIYADITLDALLGSQIRNRKLKVLGHPFKITDREGNENNEATALLQNSKWFNRLCSDLIDTIYHGYSVIEFYYTASGELDYRLIPRKHVIPETGQIVLTEADQTGIAYREMPEFGNWLLEFGEIKDLGLLNQVVPHVLFKRFAQSCWSELCEIYGIPPRIGKTNTQDGEMLSRMERMMRDMGSAAWMIIDDTEEFEFAQGVSTKGEVYQELIRLCNNEMSLAISGAVIGQDTKNGNESKETISVEMLEELVAADRGQLAAMWNSTILPALYRIGFLPDGLLFSWQKQEDLNALWKMTYEAARVFDVEPEFILEKFGIPVKLKVQNANPQPGEAEQLHRGDSGFFG